MSYALETSVNDVVNKLGGEIVGKNIIITGASPKSLASEAARAIATQRPGLLVLTARNISLLEETKANILKAVPGANLRLLQFDLGDHDSIRKAAAEVLSYTESFDALLNVAGIMATPYEKVNGVESQFAINHLGPFLFTNLILPKLKKDAPIINVTSRGYQLGSILWDDISFQKEPYNKWRAYAQSKAANILFSSALARRGRVSYSVHPGTIAATSLGRHLTQEDYDLLAGVPMEFKTIEQGPAGIVIAAFDPATADKNGGHYDDDNQIKPIPEEFPYATGVDNEDRLWELSEKLVGQKFTLSK